MCLTAKLQNQVRFIYKIRIIDYISIISKNYLSTFTGQKCISIIRLSGDAETRDKKELYSLSYVYCLFKADNQHFFLSLQKIKVYDEREDND